MKGTILAVIGTIALTLSILISACGAGAQTANAANTYGPDAAEALTVRNQQLHYIKTQPVPFFDFSLARQMLIDYYKAANNAVATYTYFVGEFPQPKAYLICPSVSFPIQGGTQLTSPVKTTDNYATGDGRISYKPDMQVITQPEPNGLYSPANGLGTQVMCLNDDGTASPVYSEPNVITFPYKLANADETLFARSGKSSINIDTKQH